jgi:hypothetical protein
MSEWEESYKEYPENLKASSDQEKEQDNALEEVNTLREQQAEEYAEELAKIEDETKLFRSPGLISAVQGYSGGIDDKGESFSDPYMNEGEEGDGSTLDIKDQYKRVAPLSDETRIKLNEIRNLPVEQRREAMGDFFKSQQNRLGNQNEEGRNLQLDATIHWGGKGVTITDIDGTEYIIDYEE